jgi:hypothetical protein
MPRASSTWQDEMPEDPAPITHTLCPGRSIALPVGSFLLPVRSFVFPVPTFLLPVRSFTKHETYRAGGGFGQLARTRFNP